MTPPLPNYALRTGRWAALRTLCLTGVLAISLAALIAQEPAVSVKGQRVFTAGHSLLMFVPGILKEVVASAQISDHASAGVQSLLPAPRILDQPPAAKDLPPPAKAAKKKAKK